MTSPYDGVVELYRTSDLKDANEHIKNGWVPCRIAEVDVPVEGESGTYYRREAAIFLGKREKPFPPPPPAMSGPTQPPNDKITQKQLDYIKSLEKRSTANATTIVQFLDKRGKNPLDLTKAEAGELINLLAK